MIVDQIDMETLPEAQRTQGIESETWIISEAKINIQIQFSQKGNSSYRLNTLGPLCLWQCFSLWPRWSYLVICGRYRFFTQSMQQLSTIVTWQLSHDDALCGIPMSSDVLVSIFSINQIRNSSNTMKRIWEEKMITCWPPLLSFSSCLCSFSKPRMNISLSWSFLRIKFTFSTVYKAVICPELDTIPIWSFPHFCP